jgi:DNA-directed RNA polymerase specialized sigma24 family protein
MTGIGTDDGGAPHRLPDARAVACPCRHGDVAAEVAAQRPLLELAVAGDREAYAQLYDVQVEGVYRYLLAWTGDRSAAAELTGQVFRSALSWLPVTAAGEGELGAWLVAMARDAVAQRRGSGWMAGPAEQPQAPQAPGDALEAVALLGDPEREVVVLRLLLGHSLVHTAHLSGYSQRAVLELQLAACLAVWNLTGGARSGQPAAHPQPEAGGLLAEKFERRLGRWDVDLAGEDPGLADALAVASSLRLAAPRQVVAPDQVFVEGLRAELLAAGGDGQVSPPEPPNRPEPVAGGPGRPSAPRVRRGPVATVRRWLVRRPWAATMVATSAIVVILGLQAFGNPGPRPACGGRPCPATTTLLAAPAGPALEPPTTFGLVEPATSTAPTTPATTPQASASTAPPTTAPPATAPRTTARRPTTTAPPTSAATTTATTSASSGATTTTSS